MLRRAVRGTKWCLLGAALWLCVPFVLLAEQIIFKAWDEGSGQK